MATGAPVIVTRPAAPGQRLVAELRRRGREVAWWPAFDIVPPPDEAAVDRALRGLARYDLALFVSPNAVHATAARLRAPWPARTVIGAVGASTREAALAELPGAALATVVAPPDGDEAGSEAFWRAWQNGGQRAQRVLLLRASGGREWIVERFRADGTAVDALAVYDRAPHALSGAESDRLRRWIDAGMHPVAIVSSTEAVGVLLDQVRPIEGGAEWLQHSPAVATHPRVAQRLMSAGFGRVATCAADDGAVIDKLESFHG